MTNKRKLWKPSKSLQQEIINIESKLTKQGYETLSIVPLLNSISVLAIKDDCAFNLRLNKNTLALESTYKLTYKCEGEVILKVTREKL